MRLRTEFDIQEQQGKLAIVRRRSNDGALAMVAQVAEPMARLIRRLQGRDFEESDISAFLQKEYAVNATQADADAVSICMEWRRLRMLEGDFGSQEKVRNAMLFLLREALWGKGDMPEGVFPLTVQEWISVYLMAGLQAVAGTIFDGLSVLPKNMLPPERLLAHWRKDVGHMERANLIADAAIFNLQKLFEEGGIPMMVLKGQGVGSLYRRPFFRQSGDIDLYFGSMEAAVKAADWIESKGMHVNRGGDDDSNFGYMGVFIEIHSRIIEQHHFFERKYLRKLEAEAFAHGIEVNRDKVGFRMPSAEMNHLLQSTHILKHLLNEGIGLRQLCDAAICLHALKGQTDAGRLVEMMKRCDVYRWSQLLYALLVKYLGLPEEDLPMQTRENPDALMEEIWTTGNFGIMDDRWGDRPEGEWGGRTFTAKRIFTKMRHFGKYAKMEVFCFMLELCFGSIIKSVKKRK